MKKGLYIIGLLVCFSSLQLSAQKTIVEDLNTSKWGQGKVTVMQDEVLEKKLAIRGDGNSTTSSDPADMGDYKGRGYKIQAFMGNNQQQSKNEAESKQAQIKRIYPDIRTELKFHSPFWKLWVGNFKTKEDADLMLQDMKKTFPSFGREMTIIHP